ncbi:MAG: glycosyl hydrolase family 8 [Candidatus Peribacteraceae bacterium]|nr:glycosyl hydrolase family 8 [Candidatus Peribacteraceae bacterium]
MRLLSRAIRRFDDEVILAIVAAAAGIAVLAFVHRLDLAKTLIDQNSHLNFARLTFDSLTPGMSQIGFWPPLLHVLLIPFVAIRPLYASGLAAAPVLVPSLFLAAVFLRRICLELTGSRTSGNIAAALLLLNPYLLYYAVTPMMEVLFIANVCATAYFLLRWLRDERMRDLILAGVFVSLACLSRYEGLMLLPVTSSILLAHLFARKRRYHQVEALLLLFGLLAVLGVTFIVAYSWLYGGTPFAFSGGSWLRDPAPGLRPARHDAVASLLYALYASFYMLGHPMVAAGLFSTGALLLLPRLRTQHAAVLFVLLSPLLFILLSEYMGTIIINVPDLPPYGFFNNDRYGLTWAGAAVAAPALLFHALRSQAASGFWKRAATVVGTAVLLFLTLAEGRRLQHTVFREQYAVVRRDINSPSREQEEVARFLSARYDGGTVLMARVDNDPLIANAAIPLNRYLYEGNYRIFDQALQDPWVFARWVVMHNAAASGDAWALQNEPVFREWGISQVFPMYYDLAFENESRRVYRLNEEHTRQLIAANGYRADVMPSMNGTVVAWDPETIYGRMHVEPGEQTKALSATKEEIRTALLPFYEQRLRPLYERGYFADARGEGTSESQSYALWQSFAVDDRETFDRVWQWTQGHLQRPDGLFHWKFMTPNPGLVLILDGNSATDSDVDIAYLLLEAGRAWDEPSYVREATGIMRSIWTLETAAGRGNRRHLTAGNWAESPSSVVMNPSYFAPYAFRAFAEVLPEYDWDGLVEQGYEDVERASRRRLGEKGVVFLPPDWVTLQRPDGTLRPFEGKDHSLDYSYDAFRTFFRIALDAAISGNEQATRYLGHATTFESDWQHTGTPCSIYPASGTGCLLSVGTLAGPLGIWSITQPRFAEQLVATHYLRDGKVNIADDAAFYERSWYWFALWLWSRP